MSANKVPRGIPTAGNAERFGNNVKYAKEAVLLRDQATGYYYKITTVSGTLTTTLLTS